MTVLSQTNGLQVEPASTAWKKGEVMFCQMMKCMVIYIKELLIVRSRKYLTGNTF